MNVPGRPGPAIGAALLAWLGAVGAGFWILNEHMTTPGAAGKPPARWPAAAGFAAEPGRANLVLAIHPRCPCSRASLAELARVVREARGPLAAHVLFWTPAGAPAGWERTDLWREAAAIPGARVRVDPGRAEAGRFGAETSGQAALYAPDGSLAFRGGISSGRGHFGPSPGGEAILAMLARRPARRADAPVFGCPLSAGRPESSSTDR